MDLAAEAVDGLPEWVHEAMDNVEVFVEDLPPPDQPGLLGLYHGVPLSKRGSGYAGALPDHITLYRAPIEQIAGAGARSGCAASSRTRWPMRWRTISASATIDCARSGRTSPCQTSGPSTSG